MPLKSKESAGLLMFRRRGPAIEVLLGHPGGPFWRTRHEGAWTIPKGAPEPGESLLDAAVREFQEETGVLPAGPFVPLGQITQRAGKVVHAWAFEGDCDPARLQSVSARIEWPPRSGVFISVPELDRVQSFEMAEARPLINAAQVELLDRLAATIDRA